MHARSAVPHAVDQSRVTRSPWASAASEPGTGNCIHREHGSEPLLRMPLKQPHAMFDPDPRSGSFARLHATGRHSHTLADHHKDIAAVRMTEAVPEAIRTEFETIRNVEICACIANALFLDALDPIVPDGDHPTA